MIPVRAKKKTKVMRNRGDHHFADNLSPKGKGGKGVVMGG